MMAANGRNTSRHPSTGTRRGRLLAVACIALAVTLAMSLSAVAFALGSVSSTQDLSAGTIDVETVLGTGGTPDPSNAIATDDTTFSAKNAGTLPFYLRASVSTSWLDNSGNEVAGADTSLIEPNVVASGSWVDGGDGYWYWQGIVQPGETVDQLVGGWGISVEVDNSYLDLTGRVNVHFEAIQATHQAADSLWGQGTLFSGVEEADTETDLGTQVHAVITDDEITIGDGDEVIDPGVLVPGGSVSFSIQVQNSSASRQAVLLSAVANDSMSSDQRDLLDRYLNVEVTSDDGTVLWSGTFGDLSGGFRETGILERNGSGTIVVTMTLDPDAPDELENLSGDVTWELSAEARADESGGGSNGGSDQIAPVAGSEGAAQKVPKTGDTMSILIPAALAAISGALLIFAVRARRREKDR